MKVSKVIPAGVSRDRVPLVKVWRSDRLDELECPVNPSFFILESDMEEMSYGTKLQSDFFSQAAKVERNWGTLFGVDMSVSRVFWYSDEQRRNTRKLLKDKDLSPLQSDRVLAQQWFTEKDLEVMDVSDIKILSIDSEVDCRSKFPVFAEANQRILTICGVDSKGERYDICDTDEGKMFDDFLELISSYDIVTGWNTSRFDLPYLKARAHVLGKKFYVPRVSFVDAMNLYSRTSYARGKSINLEDTARRELGRDIKQGFEGINLPLEMWQSFNGDRTKLVEYCSDDARAALDIFTLDRLGVADLYVRMAQVAHVPYEDVESPSKILDSPMIKAVNAEGMCFPDARFRFDLSRDYFGEVSYEGAVVFDPIKGLHNAVAVEDFSSMYARMCMVFNLASDCISLIPSTDDIVAPETEVHFRRSPSSKIRKVLEKLEHEKLRYRALKKKSEAERGLDDPMTKHYDMTSEAFKTILLASWGVFGDEDSRFFRQEVAESITAFGRWLLNCAKTAAESIGLTVIYGDSDSVFLKQEGLDLEAFKSKLPEYESAINSKISEKIKERFGIVKSDYPVYDVDGDAVLGDLTLKMDYLFRRFYIPAKKRYIGMRQFPNGSEEIFSRGFGRDHYGVFELASESEDKIFTMIFNSPDVKSASEATARYVESLKPRLFSGELDNKLVIRMRPGMPLDEYQTDLPHVAAARELEKAGLYRQGDIVRYVVVGDVKGKLVVKAVHRVVPRIGYSGYVYYLKRLTKLLTDVFGSTRQSMNLMDIYSRSVAAQ